MLRIEVLGFECTACRKTYRLIDEAACRLGVEIELTKIDDPARIAAHQVLRVPAVVVDGKLVHSGGCPSRQQVERWLQATPPE